MKYCNTEDIVGKKFNNLTVIKYLKKEKYEYANGRSRNNYFYECSCSCGNVIVAKRVDLITEHTKSCGCWNKKLSASPRWTGFEQISGVVIGKIKFHARKRNIKFDITKEELWQKFLDQDMKCALTGVSLYFSKTMKEEWANFRTASLDRIDSSKHYTFDNVQWVHKDVNVMKMDFTLERYLEVCTLVSEHAKNKRGLLK